MQDIVFYAAANETLGIVRDYANARNQSAPVLVLGVAACLRIRLFAACEVAAPYPLAAFSGIVDWQWNMDADFDRSTTCKLTADEGDISVHSVTDTVNGETLDFTEFVIPISNMNTQELAAWLGSEKKRSGLNGELVGYDSAGNAAFVLQIENFTVRNRVAGLGDPTALDQGIVTRSLAEQMIQTAVSSSAAVKQDKLTSANAGTGISITSNGVISTANVPQSAITGLSASLAAKQDNIAVGDLIEISGMTVNRKRYMNIIENANIISRTITPTGSSASVQALVLEPGNAYRINAVSSAKWLATTAAFKESTGTWGIEGHIELFVAGTGYVRTDSNVVLANALEPDAVNNCTVRFHDGLAIISVEDHVAGYIVVSATGSTSGTLPYALSTATQEYVAFNASLNGQMLDLGGTTTYAGEKHIVGNGYTETILSGGITCTAKTTFSNLSMDGVSVNGGTMTMGDVNIPNGATVSLNGGSLAVEKVSGNGGVIDLGGIQFSPQDSMGDFNGLSASGVNIINGYAAYGGVGALFGASQTYSGCVFSGNSAGAGGAFRLTTHASCAFTSCTFKNNSATSNGGAIQAVNNAKLSLYSCVFEGNDLTVDNGKALCFIGSGAIVVSGCTFREGQSIANYNTSLSLAGSNVIDTLSGTSGVTISSGAIIDLTGNTNATPIAPGGGITFAPGGATVYPSAGSASAYVLGGVTVPKIGNTNVLDLEGTQLKIQSNATATASGCEFINGLSTAGGGAIYVSSGADVHFSSCVFSSNYASGAGNNGAIFTNRASATFVSCTITSNRADNNGGGIYVNSGYCLFSDCVLSGNQKGSVSYFGADAMIGAGTVYMMGGTYGEIYNNGAITITDECKIDKLYGPHGTVTIASGAIIDLTAATSSIAIAPGGAINIPARPSGQDVKIKYTSGGGSDFNTFTGLEIRGTTITNQGIIYGATVTIPADTPETWLLSTTESQSTIELTSANAGDYVVAGGLKGIDML